MNEFERIRREQKTDVEFARSLAQLRGEIEQLGRDISWHRRSIVQTTYLALAGVVLALLALGLVGVRFALELGR